MVGIAYREMGLTRRSHQREFQKVASAADKGARFPLCHAMLVRCWAWHSLEKGQPGIAAILFRAGPSRRRDWIKNRFLRLRYDLGVAQELAGDTHAAFTSFSRSLRK